MTTSFLLDVSHSQLAIFDSSLEEPFNEWTEGHVAQGFSWRPGSVSFSTVEEAGRHGVEIVVAAGDIDLPSDAMRIIQTPFEVPKDGSLEVASISSSAPFSLPPGLYQLRYEYFAATDGSEPRIRFVFIKTAHPFFKILRADAILCATDDLILTASPA